MSNAALEHINITASNPEGMAESLCELFNWHVRWKGESIYGGYTVHVGDDSSYLAIYRPPGKLSSESSTDTYQMKGGLNHIGILVEDLDAAEQRVRKAGYSPRSHADYEPGRRFYFDFVDGLEIELISYA